MATFIGTLEVELTAGNWTDITSYLAFRSGPVAIRQGRPTEYDDVAAGVMTFQLWNDDGRFMPGNTGSSLYPNWAKGKRVRWKVARSGATYTRFVGWIQAIAPDFPGTSTNDAIVSVTATDALGLLAQRVMRSNLTEISLWRGRADSTWCDAWEGDPRTSGMLSYMINYSTDSTASSPQVYINALLPVLSFSDDNDVDIGAVATCRDISSCKTLANIQSGALQLKLHLKSPTGQVAATGGPFFCTTFHSATGGASSIYHLAIDRNASTGNKLLLRDAAGTSTVATLADPLAQGQWLEIVAYSRVDNAARSDWYVVKVDGSSTGVTNLAVDIRSIRCIEYPSATGYYAASSLGGIVALGSRTPINWQESYSGATNGTISGRVTTLASVLNQLPVTISQVGTLTTSVATGKQSGRSALVVLQRLVRTGGGIAWARSRDSTVYAIGSDQLYPYASIATIDTDADCVGAPRLVDGAEAVPSRVDVSWPGGTTLVVDRTLETSGTIRSRSVETVAATPTVAYDAGQGVLDAAAGGLRISQITVDLQGASTDHLAELLSESGTLSGLFPTQRVRLIVPTSHFGKPTRDVHIEGWQEAWGPDVASITMDTTPGFSYIALDETWTGSNGAAWSGTNWTAAVGSGTSGSTIDIQSNRGRMLNGAGGNVWRRNGVSLADVEITGLIQVQGTAEAQVGWRTDSSLSNGYLIIFSVSGGVRIQQVVSGSISTRYNAATVGGPSISASTDYRFRLRHQGAYLSVRVWAASGSEPGTWNLNTTDTLYTAAGYVGLGQWYASQTALFDDLLIETGA